MEKVILLLAMLLALSGCGAASQQNATAYQQITAEEAKKMIDELEDEIILDVREQEEYDEKHIPDAVLLPVGMIDEDTAEGVISEKDSVVLVYCRSGNRSKTAAETLAELGYTQIYEFGGINDWPYETE
ncbi:rhodanese-like domain-containing protein [Anaerotignum sp.]